MNVCKGKPFFQPYFRQHFPMLILWAALYFLGLGLDCNYIMLATKTPNNLRRQPITSAALSAKYMVVLMFCAVMYRHLFILS